MGLGLGMGLDVWLGGSIGLGIGMGLDVWLGVSIGLGIGMGLDVGLGIGMGLGLVVGVLFFLRNIPSPKKVGNYLNCNIYMHPGVYVAVNFWFQLILQFN